MKKLFVIMAVSVWWIAACGGYPIDDSKSDGCSFDCEEQSKQEQELDNTEYWSSDPVHGPECPGDAECGRYSCGGDSLYQCVCDGTDGYNGASWLRYVQDCADGCVDEQDGQAHCNQDDCSIFHDECLADHPNPYGFCENGDLYNCLVACDTECGCFGRKEPLEECQGECIDDQNGNAYCCEAQPKECPEYVESEDFFCEGTSLYQCHYECTQCACATHKAFINDCQLGCVSTDSYPYAYCL